MIVTVFRARLRPESVSAYMQLAPKMAEMAAGMPGYLSHKAFTAEDGERLTLVEFDSEEALRGWAAHPDHVRAKRSGRKKFFAEYSVQICNVIRDNKFQRD